MKDRDEVHRVSMDMSEEAYQVVREIADGSGVTKAEVIRRALGLMRFVMEERHRGGRIIVEDPDRLGGFVPGKRKEIVGI